MQVLPKQTSTAFNNSDASQQWTKSDFHPAVEAEQSIVVEEAKQSINQNVSSHQRK